MDAAPSLTHDRAFRFRRAANWFPLGLAYAMLYMGRYNLTVAKNALGDLMTKEDFGFIFGAGTFVYALAFLINGPLVDRLGGRFGMLTGVAGAAAANAMMGWYLKSVFDSGAAADAPLRLVFSVLYGLNMYFQSFGAVSIVKVNASWFHVRERGGFSGIFGTMIASGIFLAYSVNGWLLEAAKGAFPTEPVQWVVFAVPAALLFGMWGVEFFLLRDSPSQAGHSNFETGDASQGQDDRPIPAKELFKRLLTHPIIITVALVEFCTGVLRNGVMHWFPIYAKEVWILPSSHPLVNGDWSAPVLIASITLGIIANAAVARLVKGRSRQFLISVVSMAALSPFFVAGWGGLLFVAGVIGANVAGWVSDLMFQSRRGPAAFFLYALLAVSTLGMAFALGRPATVVAVPAKGSALQPQDRILEVEGMPVQQWEDIGPKVACVRPTCIKSGWDAKACVCTSALPEESFEASGLLRLTVDRGGQRLELQQKDPLPKQRAGDRRSLKDQPQLPLSPWALGALVFVMSLCVIGTHGLLSGTATMDFGGRKGAATAVGVIDGFVYLGTAVQSVALGYLTTANWAFWPWFLLPFAAAGSLLLTRIWHAKPGGGGSGH